MEVAQQILEAIPHPALLIGAGDRIVAINALAAPVFGADIAGRPLLMVIRQPSVLDAVEGCRSLRRAQSTRYLTHDGQQEVSYSVHCAWIELPSGVSGVVASFNDVTQVEQAGQIRRDFVANVSHELRTPLTALTGFIETLQGPANNDPVARARFLAIMAEEADRMNRLVRDLLSLSQVEARERQRPDGSVDLAALLRETCAALQPVAQKGKVQLDCDMGKADAPPPEVPGDSEQLRQVFSNLIENAIKYSGEGCTVTLRLHGPERESGLRGPAMRVVVTDTGPGIAAVHLPRLTERFYRVDGHRSRRMGGTGLGLAIVKHIVNRHRGRLRIESTPGQGSSFTVILPVTY